MAIRQSYLQFPSSHPFLPPTHLLRNPREIGAEVLRRRPPQRLPTGAHGGLSSRRPSIPLHSRNPNPSIPETRRVVATYITAIRRERRKRFGEYPEGLGNLTHRRANGALYCVWWASRCLLSFSLLAFTCACLPGKELICRLLTILVDWGVVSASSRRTVSNITACLNHAGLQSEVALTTLLRRADALEAKQTNGCRRDNWRATTWHSGH